MYIFIVFIYVYCICVYKATPEVAIFTPVPTYGDAVAAEAAVAADAESGVSNSSWVQNMEKDRKT